jgi:transposase
VKRFNAHGLAGLHEGERPGRPTRLSDAQWVAVDDDLRQSPAAFGYGGNLWDGKTLAHHLAVRYGVEMGVRQSQRVFGQLDFRLRKPRPVIAQGDPAAQAAYKKTPPPDRRPKD